MNEDLEKYLNKDTWKFGARIAKIVRVDYERMTVDLDFMTGMGASDVPLAQPFNGPRAFIGGIPEDGSLVVTIWDHAINLPIIVAYYSYLPKRARNSDIVYDPHLENHLRLSRAKFYKGEVGMISQQLSMVRLGQDIEIINRNGNEFTLRNADQAAILVALSKYEVTAAGRTRNGMVIRNDALRYRMASDPMLAALVSDFNGLPNRDDLLRGYRDRIINNEPKEIGSADFELNGLTPIILDNGKRYFPITRLEVGVSKRRNLDEQGLVWVEDRRDLREFTDGILDVSEFQAETDEDFLLRCENPDLEKLVLRSDPKEDNERLRWLQKSILYLSTVEGTLVGNDQTKPEYGKVLKRKTFVSFQAGIDLAQNPLVGDNRPRFEPLESAEEERTLGEAYTKDFAASHRSGGNLDTVFSVNKEGKLQITLSDSSSLDKSGKGISAELLTQGAVKAHIGATKELKGPNYKSIEESSRIISWKDLKKDSQDGVVNPPEGFTEVPKTDNRVPVLDGVSGERLYDESSLSEKGHSVILTTDGSVDISVLNADDKNNAFSLEIKTGNANVVIKNGDYNKYVGGTEVVTTRGVIRNDNGAYKHTVNGDVEEIIVGKRTLDIDGEFRIKAKSLDLEISEPTTAQFGSDRSEKYNGLHASEIQGKKSEVVQGKVDKSYRGGEAKSVIGSSSLSATGNIDQSTTQAVNRTAYSGSKDSVYLGNHETEVLTGDIIRQVLLQGNIKEQTTLGNIEYRTMLGNITVESLAGESTFRGQSQAKVESLIKAILQAPEVVVNTFSGPSSIKLGGDAATFSFLIAELFAIFFDTHTHVATGFNIPTSPPVIPLSGNLNALTSQVVKVTI